jgi:hypothetical protein
MGATVGVVIFAAVFTLLGGFRAAVTGLLFAIFLTLMSIRLRMDVN